MIKKNIIEKKPKRLKLLEEDLNNMSGRFVYRRLYHTIEEIVYNKLINVWSLDSVEEIKDFLNHINRGIK